MGLKMWVMCSWMANGSFVNGLWTKQTPNGIPWTTMQGSSELLGCKKLKMNYY